MKKGIIYKDIFELKKANHQEALNRGFKHIIKILLSIPLVFLLGCTTVRFEHPIPPDANITINVNTGGWKSNVGRNNTLNQNTDAKIPLSTLGTENPVESED